MSEISRFAILFSLLVVVFATCAGDKPEPCHTENFPISRLTDDFDQYVSLINSDHPKTFTDTAALERTIAEQRKLLRDGMTEMEFYSVIAPVGAAVRCGHARTRLSEPGQACFEKNGRVLPAEIRVINDRLYVYKDFTPDEVLPRAGEVIEINGRPAAEIIEDMRASRYADGTNITYKDYAINRSFARLFTLLFGGAPDFELELVSPDSGKPTTLTVAAITPNQSKKMNVTRYRPEPECDRLCTSFPEDGDYAVLTVKDFGYYDNVDVFRDPVGEFFARLRRDEIKTLIIDVRGNDGGDPYCSSFIVSHVIPEPVRYFAADTRFYDDLVQPIPVPENVFAGELIVLTDGWCFSSTGHMLSLLRCYRRGVFVGEESGGSTACNDASKEHVLKYTGLRFNVPRATFATSATCLPPGCGIPPDIEVRPTIEDLIAGRDVIMEKAVSLAVSQ